MILVVYMAAKEYYNDAMTMGDITSFMLYLIYLINSIITFITLLETMINVFGSSQTISELMDHKPNIKSTGGHYPNEKEPYGEISFKNVTFTYPSKDDVQVLKNISFDIPRNKVIAIVGKSGCGKSTIL